MFVVVMIDNWVDETKAWAYNNKEEAMKALSEMYLSKADEWSAFIEEIETFISDDGIYAQVSDGIETIEYRLAEVKGWE